MSSHPSVCNYILLFLEYSIVCKALPHPATSLFHLSRQVSSGSFALLSNQVVCVAFSTHGCQNVQAALNMQTMSLAADLKDDGITVICYCPGW